MKLRAFILTVTLSFVLLFTSCQDNATNQGDQFFESGNYNDAIVFYTNYLTDHPEDEKTLFNRARAYEEVGMFDKAADDLVKIIELSPKNTTYYMSSGIVNFKRKEYKKVLGDMMNLIKVTPNNPDAYVLKGRAHVHIGEVMNAEDSYTTALKFDSRHAEAYLHMGIMKGLQGFKREACSNLKKAKEYGAAGAEKEMERFCK